MQKVTALGGGITFATLAYFENVTVLSVIFGILAMIAFGIFHWGFPKSK